MTTKQAIQAIITYNTSPPQIDYTLPWRSKSIKAQQFLDSISRKEREEAEHQIAEAIREYYGPDGAAQYDILF